MLTSIAVRFQDEKPAYLDFWMLALIVLLFQVLRRASLARLASLLERFAIETKPDYPNNYELPLQLTACL